MARIKILMAAVAAAPASENVAGVVGGRLTLQVLKSMRTLNPLVRVRLLLVLLVNDLAPADEVM
jgi:hypothetical protein